VWVVAEEPGQHYDATVQKTIVKQWNAADTKNTIIAKNIKNRKKNETAACSFVFFYYIC
jgi:hypothetical protein